MSSTIDDRVFLQSQIQEIQRVLNEHKNENPNHVILKWIEEHAEEYRKSWEKDHVVLS